MSAAYEAFGKYVLLEKLATGGMAEVFLARGTGAGGIGKFFAIKRILPQYADSPEFIDMFKDEAKIAINLSHSNIVSIHEFGVEKGQFFLVMDYVEGRNLRQILNKMKKTGLQFTVEQIVYIIKEVAAGLDHAHRCIDGTTGKPLNITHRDMSPQNVMVSFEGEVKIVDFGIAKAESQIETTRAGTLKGKFGYMSPEQAEGQAVDLRTDIFSLGIVLWELLANDRLFVANNELNTLRKIRDCQIPSLRKLNPNIHTELERIVQKALARDRNLRYQTGAALHRDLNRFLNRQYPDFSTQDFAVAIKSVFADEILALRRRLVDYAKINLHIDLTIPRNNDDPTSLLNPDTGSVVVTDSGSEPKSMDTVTKGLFASDATEAESSLHFTNLTKTEPTPAPPASQEEPTVIPTDSGNALTLLDEAALRMEASRQIDVRSRVQPLDVGFETEDVTSPSYHNRRSSRGTSTRIAIPRDNPAKPVRFATFLVFLLLCMSVYAYLVKYFPSMMSEVILTTDPMLHELHMALGVDLQQFDRAPTQIPAPPLPPPTLPPPPPVEPPREKVRGSLAVASNPSGAEIFINDSSTGLMTPTQIEVPAEGTFTIMLRKRGYYDVKRNEVTRESLGGRFEAALKKMNIAYLDVEIFPPQEAVLYVNGKPVPLRRSTASVAIPGNTSVKVRAESPTTNTFHEVTVRVPSDRRKSLQLNPKKTFRVPSGLPGK